MISDTIKYIGVDDPVLTILTSICLRVSMWCLRA